LYSAEHFIKITSCTKLY